MSLKSFAAVLGAGVVVLGAAALRPADAYVLTGTTPGKWGPASFGTGATVTWSLMPTGTDCTAFFENGGAACTITHLGSFMPSGYLTAVEAAFNAWSAVANLTFMQVTDFGEAVFPGPQLSGDIRIGGHAFDGPGGVLAHAYFPPNNGGAIAGDVHFDIADTWKIGFGGGGFDIFQVLAHEVGHSLGLDHTLVPNSLLNAYYTEVFSGPQADDIEGMQFIYGAPVATPEPVSLAVLAGGLLGLGLARRRLVA